MIDQYLNRYRQRVVSLCPTQIKGITNIRNDLLTLVTSTLTAIKTKATKKTPEIQLQMHAII